MAEIPRLRQISGSGSGKKISVSEHVTNGVDSIPDSFIVDLGSFSNGGGLYHHISADSRIILPRSFSRKGYQRAAGDSTCLLLAATCSSPPSPSSPSPGGQTGPSSMQEKPTATSHPPAVVIAVEPTDDSDDLKPQPNSHPHHHQITMKTSSIAPAVSSSSSSPESQLGRRRSPLPWYSHPKRVLLFFATISSIGTLLLICFTLAINKPYSSSD